MKIYPKFTNEELAALSLGGELPHHVGIIMDGNGRWAKAKGMPRNYGHMQGAKTVEVICEEAYRMGIQYLTVYAFSTENWNRPQDEVDALMKLLDDHFHERANNQRKIWTVFTFLVWYKRFFVDEK